MPLSFDPDDAIEISELPTATAAVGMFVPVVDTADTSQAASGTNKKVAILAFDAELKAWTQGEDYEPTSITRDANDVVTSATVKWPDGSAGTFTATTINATFNTVDAFTVTHANSGRTITQSAVTRNANGAVTAKPALVVS